MVGQSVVLSPQPAAPLSPRLSSGGFPTLPPIASAFGKVKDGPKKLSPMKHNSRSSRSSSPALKRWQTSPAAAENSHKQLHGIRGKLSDSKAENEALREERDELARQLERANYKISREKEVSASHAKKIEDLQDEVKTLKEQLDCQGFIRNHMELEHKRSLELTCARHRFELDSLETKYSKELSSLRDQLEETVLKAAIDLNRQHRQLSSEQLKLLRGRRRATDGGMPLIDFSLPKEALQPEASQPDETSSTALLSSVSVPKVVIRAPPKAAASQLRRYRRTSTRDDGAGFAQHEYKKQELQPKYKTQSTSRTQMNSESSQSSEQMSSSMCSSSTCDIDTTLGLVYSNTSGETTNPLETSTY